MTEKTINKSLKDKLQWPADKDVFRLMARSLTFKNHPMKIPLKAAMERMKTDGRSN